MEDTGLAEAATPVETTPAPQTESFIGTDGSLKEGWTGILDEGYRDEKTLSTIKDVKSLAKIAVDTKRMVGKNKIAIPTESSAPEEWAEYYRVGGRPDTVEDYGLAAPEGFPQELVEQVFPADRVAKWQERFYKGGVSKKAAQQFINEFAQDMAADYQNIQQQKEQKKAEIVSALSTEYGAAFDQKMHLGDIAFEEGSNGDESMKESLAYLRDDPNAIRLLVNLGAKFAEGKSPDFSAVPTPADYKSQIAEIMENPLYLNGTKQQRDRLVAQVMSIRAKMTPEPATT